MSTGGNQFASQAEGLRKSLATKGHLFWERRGEKRVLKLFHEMARRVPAYKDFLRHAGVRPGGIKTIKDFKQLPLLSKENYLKKYSLAEVCWDGSVPFGATIAESSGTTGASHLWPRTSKQEIAAAELQSALFTTIFNLEKTRSIFVVCFHLGAHIAGMITVDAIKRMLDAGIPGALVTPGLQRDDTLRLVKRLSPLYEQIILVGYPPFIKDVITAGAANDILWGKKKIGFVFSGESFPESWREAVVRLAGQSGKNSSINLYGSADLGLMGFETPLTITLRQAAARDAALAELFGGSTDFVPPIYQYLPESKFFEAVDGTLVCSADLGLPLVRYAIHDLGSVVPFQHDQLERFAHKGAWSLPFVSVLGRKNYTATFYALNIYPEHIREILVRPSLARFVSGKFFIKTVYNKEHDQFLELHIELSAGEQPAAEMGQRLAGIIAEELQKMNLEYKKLTAAIGERARPVVRLYPYNSEAFRAIKMKHKYIVQEEL